MARTISEYLDAAKSRQGYVSDNKLNLALGMASSSAVNWRNGKIFPSEKSMILLAELAGLPIEEALLDLQIAKTKDAKTREVWEALRRRSRDLVASVMLAGVLAGAAGAAPAQAGNKSTAQGAELYIMRKRRPGAPLRLT